MNIFLSRIKYGQKELLINAIPINALNAFYNRICIFNNDNSILNTHLYNKQKNQPNITTELKIIGKKI